MTYPPKNDTALLSLSPIYQKQVTKFAHIQEEGF